MPPVPGGPEGRRRQFAECKTIVASKMARVEKTARECRGDHGVCAVGLLKHASGVLQPDALDEGHRRAVARISEGFEYAAGAGAGGGCKGLDGDRAVPIGKDVVLDPVDLPRRGTWLLALDNIAEIMRIGRQEGHEQHLLELDKRRGWHFCVVTVKLAHHEFEHPSQALERRVVKARSAGEFDVSGHRHPRHGTQLGLQRRSLDPENELLETCLIFVCHLDTGRNDGRLTPIDIELQFVPVGTTHIRPETFRVCYLGLITMDITKRITDRVTVSEQGLHVTGAQLPHGHHRLVLLVADQRGRLARQEAVFNVL